MNFHRFSSALLAISASLAIGLSGCSLSAGNDDDDDATGALTYRCVTVDQNLETSGHADNCGSGSSPSPLLAAPADIVGTWQVEPGVILGFVNEDGIPGAFILEDGVNTVQAGLSLSNGVIVMPIAASTSEDPRFSGRSNIYLKLVSVNSFALVVTALTDEEAAAELGRVRLVCTSASCGNGNTVAQQSKVATFVGTWDLFWPPTQETFKFTFNSDGTSSYTGASGTSSTGTFVVTADISILRFATTSSAVFRSDEFLYFRIHSVDSTVALWDAISVDEAIINPEGVELPFNCKTPGTCGTGTTVDPEDVNIANAVGVWVLETVPGIPLEFDFKADGSFTFTDTSGNGGSGTVVFSTGKAEVDMKASNSAFIPAGTRNFQILSTATDNITILQIGGSTLVQ